MNFSELEVWFLNNREKMKYKTLKYISKTFNEKIKNNQFRVFCFGVFDEKICTIHYEKAHTTLICSIDKSLSSTEFFKKYLKKAKSLNENIFSFICDFIDFKFLQELCTPKIALLSLAKNDVYTFPRFALGISDIAHAIRKNFKGTVSLNDLQLNSNLNNFINECQKTNIDIIGISMTFGLFDVLEKVLEHIEEANLKCLIVVGGSLASLTYKEILKKYSEIIVSIGEGEDFFVKFIDYFHGRINLHEIPNTIFMDSKTGKIFETNQSKFCKNVEISVPELDLLIPTIKAKGVFQIETSRGCYNNCTFCPRKQKGIWRGNLDSVQKIKTLIEYFCEYLKNENYCPSDFIIYIVDEEFVGGEGDLYRDRAINISNIFAKYNLKYETSFKKVEF